MRYDTPGLCGKIVVVSLTYQDREITDDTRPVFTTTDTTDSTLNIYSEDLNLTGSSGTYSINVRLESYFPRIPAIVKNGIINYVHPCDSPTFTAPSSGE